MDGRQIIIYIILIAVYLLSRALKPNKKGSIPRIPRPPVDDDIHSDTPEPTPRPYEMQSKSKPVTFEDLLKDFTDYHENAPEALPAETAEVKEIKKTVVENPFLTEIEPYVKEASSREIQFGKVVQSSQHFSYDDAFHGPEKMVLSDTQAVDTNKGRYGQYVSQKDVDVHKASRFRTLLHNPISMKDAIIMKEVLDRKYF